MINAIPVILCGGGGTRLWPLSRSGFPKQFLPLVGEKTLFQKTLERFFFIDNSEINMVSPMVVCGDEHRFLMLDQLKGVDVDIGCAVLEPFSRNTAPALTLAALQAFERGDDPILIVSPADHEVQDIPSFAGAVESAIKEAMSGSVVLLGIQPNSPETGYGYIQVEPSENLANDSVFKVKNFVEKPNLTSAMSYLERGGYLWNAGIFVLKSSTWLAMLEKFRHDIFTTTKSAWDQRSIDQKFIRPGRAEFDLVPSESIDSAVMEHCLVCGYSLKVIPIDVGWSDLGAWNSVWQILPKDDRGNASFGDVLAVESYDTLTHASSRLVCVLGVRNLIIVETADAVLVADKSNGQDLKSLVNLLGAKDRVEHLFHRKVDRPWGWYDCIDAGEGFKVKRIQVNPKASLSLQRHRCRAEHWVVVRGVAEVTRGDETLLWERVKVSISPLGEMHRLSNPGDSTLEIIEVQTGRRLEESDIERFEDDYGR